MTVTTDESWRL